MEQVEELLPQKQTVEALLTSEAFSLACSPHAAGSMWPSSVGRPLRAHGCSDKDWETHADGIPTSRSVSPRR